MSKLEHKAEKIRNGEYLYRGYKLQLFPAKKHFQKNFWLIEKGPLMGHCSSIKQAKKDIDKHLDQKQNSITKFSLKSLPDSVYQQLVFKGRSGR